MENIKTSVTISLRSENIAENIERPSENESDWWIRSYTSVISDCYLIVIDNCAIIALFKSIPSRKGIE